MQSQILKRLVLTKLLNGEQKDMMQKKIDEVANLWEKTKDPKYKDLWYKYIKEFVNGTNNINRRSVSSDSSNESNVKRYDDSSQGRLF